MLSFAYKVANDNFSKFISFGVYIGATDTKAALATGLPLTAWPLSSKKQTQESEFYLETLIKVRV